MPMKPRRRNGALNRRDDFRERTLAAERIECMPYHIPPSDEPVELARIVKDIG